MLLNYGVLIDRAHPASEQDRAVSVLSGQQPMSLPRCGNTIDEHHDSLAFFVDQPRRGLGQGFGQRARDLLPPSFFDGLQNRGLVCQLAAA